MPQVEDQKKEYGNPQYCQSDKYHDCNINSILGVMLESLKNVVVIGDRVLIKPLDAANKTDSGLFLPPSVKERDAVHTGIVMRVGPGYPIPSNQDSDSLFREENSNQVNYVPLQVHEGDEALYLHASSTELEINGEKYVIVGQNAILLVMRNEIPDSVDNL